MSTNQAIQDPGGPDGPRKNSVTIHLENPSGDITTIHEEMSEEITENIKNNNETEETEEIEEDPHVSLDAGDFPKVNGTSQIDIIPTTSKLNNRYHNGNNGSVVNRIPMSSMEEESLRERLRASLLKQCAEILQRAESSRRFSRDTFRRIFQNRVSTYEI